MESAVPDLLLDTISLIHPLPILKAKKAIDSMQSGQLLEVCTKDAAAKADIIHLVQRMKLELINISEEDGIIRICIKK